ncbi:hypothetical protein ACFC0A_11230, partial [Kitasatospora purpeofusca]
MTDAENGAPEESPMSPDTGGAVPAQASAEPGPADAEAGADAGAEAAGTDGDAGSGSADGESADAGSPDAAGPGGDAADRAAAVAALAERVRSVGRSGPGDAASSSVSSPGSAPEDAAAPATPADGTGTGTDRVVTDEQRAQALRATAEVLGAGGAPAELAAAAVSLFG